MLLSSLIVTARLLIEVLVLQGPRQGCQLYVMHVFLYLLLRLHLYVGDFTCFTGFQGKDVCDAGDFICLVGEREKQCPGRRLTLNVGDLTALA